MRKGGAGLDLPIAVGLLLAAGELSPGCTEGLSFCGELGLNGSLRHVPGMIALADTAAPRGLVVPLCDVREAALVRGTEVRGAATLGDLVAVLRGRADWPAVPALAQKAPAPLPPDLADVQGQALGRTRPDAGQPAQRFCQCDNRGGQGHGRVKSSRAG